MWWTSTKYGPVRSSIESGESEETKLYLGDTIPERKSSKDVIRRIITWLPHFLLLYTQVALLFMSLRREPECQCSAVPMAQELGT